MCAANSAKNVVLEITSPLFLPKQKKEQFGTRLTRCNLIHILRHLEKTIVKLSESIADCGNVGLKY